MQYRLRQSLGTVDARHCNKELGASIDLKKLSAGDVIDLNDESCEYLGKKYPALLEPAEKVRGQAKHAEITAPAK